MSASGPRQTPNPKRGPSLPRRKPSAENGTIPSHRSRSAASRPERPGTERTVKRMRLSKALTVPDTTTVAEACRRMASKRVDAALLTNSSALLCGIVTDKDVATRVIAEGLNPEETPVSKVMTKSPTFVMSDTLAVEALQKMVQGKFRHLPIVDNGEVIALLDITKCLYDAIVRMERAALKGNALAAAVEDVERQFGSGGGQSDLIETLREKLFRPTLATIVNESTRLASVSPSDSVFTATKKMRDLKVNSVVVVAGSKPVGIFTSKDVLMRVVSQGISADTVVEKIMTTNPECATLEMTIVDALHTMHDGKFLHLPVVNKEARVVACIDVLQITHAAFATVGHTSSVSGDGGGGMMQKFFDSAFAEHSTEDDDDSRSDVSAKPDAHVAANPNAFSFKLEDQKGRVHRFQCVSDSLKDLVSAIQQRVGASVFQVLYQDDEGDRVILSSDGDLMEAINFARLSGSKGLKLFLDGSTKQTLKEKPAETQPFPPPLTTDLATKTASWTQNPTTTATIAASAAMLVGVSVLVYLKRSNQ